MAQQKYLIQIQLLSDTLIGAAEGYGAVIDKDSVFDEVGLPIIPGKRVKGIFREQADLLQKHQNLLETIDII
jgi:CRISPR-associated protein Csx10